jgi:putative restriction endonuclease
MKAFIAVTDSDWFEFLSRRPDLDEVNFWRPGGSASFKALSLGGPMLFKLHWPDNFIVGGGFFASFSRLPVSIAWDAFGVKNGAPNFPEFRARIERLKKIKPNPREDYQIGNIVLQDPFFLPRERWIPPPADFLPTTVQGKGYKLTESPGRELWQDVMAARATQRRAVFERPDVPSDSIEIEGPMFGEGQRGRVRLRQGAFRVMVTDAYERRCAISGERALPVLQAAHIVPVASGGQNRLDNGLLLRSDVHTLFDRGYITVTPEHRILVATKRLKEDFDNGEPYAPFHGTMLHAPGSKGDRPSPQQLKWHNERRYVG